MRYKEYPNKLRHILKTAETQHYSDLLINCQNGIKTWKIINNIMNKNIRVNCSQDSS